MDAPRAKMLCLNNKNSKKIKRSVFIVLLQYFIGILANSGKAIGVNIPTCVKVILIGCGYDNLLSIQNINEHLLNEIETYATDKLVDDIKRINCCHSSTYHSQFINRTFGFVPGHRALILELGKCCSSSEIIAKITEKTINDTSAPALSNLLAELVRTAHANFGQPIHLNRYSEMIKCFAMYIFMVCEKFCYEIICKNLPMPATSTVRECLLNI